MLGRIGIIGILVAGLSLAACGGHRRGGACELDGKAAAAAAPAPTAPSAPTPEAPPAG